MKRYSIVVLLVIASLPALAGRGQQKASIAPQGGASSRVLLVVAHPDDEYEMAGTVYRIAKELSGVVDQVIISDGQGGYRYSGLAGHYYGADLGQEAVGRSLLPRIRKEEAQGSARVLGIQRQWFLAERDDHYTLDVQEVLQKTWKTARVLDWLVARLQKGHYDFVLVLLPTEDTHGQHKAASILALEAVERLPEYQRPVVLGALASTKETDSYKTLPGYPITAATSAEPEFHFDRDVHFGVGNTLSYQIVVNWVIAEHKSQGQFQTLMGQDRFENFWLLAASGGSATEKATALFDEISPKRLPSVSSQNASAGSR